MFKSTIHTKVRDLIDLYPQDITRSTHVKFNMKQTLDQIEAYLNSTFITGANDKLGNPKPFANISIGKRNIAKTNTDIDRKDIIITGTGAKDSFKAFVATLKLRQVLNKLDFGSFLNQLGEDAPTYGSVITEIYEQNGKLIQNIKDWQRTYTDRVNIEDDVIVTAHYLNKAQLFDMAKIHGWDEQAIMHFVDLVATERKDISGNAIDHRADFYEIFQVDGLLENAYLSKEPIEDEKDPRWNVFSDQRHFIAFAKDGKEDVDITFYKGTAKPSTDVFHWEKHRGRALGVGIIEKLFQPQQWVNYTIKQMKEQLDIASKILMQTSDTNFTGRNVLSSIQNGQVLIHAPNQPLTAVANDPKAIPALQAIKGMWDQNADAITSTPEVLAGRTLPGSTALGTVQIMQDEAKSDFRYILEQKGLFIERLLRKYYIPYAIKHLDDDKELIAELEPEEIAYFDQLVSESMASEQLKSAVLGDKIPDTNNLQTFKQRGNKRYMHSGDKKWSDYFKDFEWNVTVNITGEALDKAAAAQNVLQIVDRISSNPNLTKDPTAQRLLNEALSISGMQPMKFESPSVVGPQLPTNQ